MASEDVCGGADKSRQRTVSRIRFGMHVMSCDAGSLTANNILLSEGSTHIRRTVHSSKCFVKRQRQSSCHITDVETVELHNRECALQDARASGDTQLWKNASRKLARWRRTLFRRKSARKLIAEAESLNG
eukprot:4783104-Karenia_brevis.AAC.1